MITVLSYAAAALFGFGAGTYFGGWAVLRSVWDGGRVAVRQAAAARARAHDTSWGDPRWSDKHEDGQ